MIVFYIIVFFLPCFLADDQLRIFAHCDSAVVESLRLVRLNRGSDGLQALESCAQMLCQYIETSPDSDITHSELSLIEGLCRILAISSVFSINSGCDLMSLSNYLQALADEKASFPFAPRRLSKLKINQLPN
jgi:hypothetical protein